MMEPASAGTGATRASLRVGGVSLARHQLALVLALGCERIICLARAADPDVVALQHAAEAAGARFHIATGARGLMGLISTADEIIVLNEGLLAAPQEAIALLEPGLAVVVQPVEPGLIAGFERIDHSEAAGGALRMPGRLVERLSELPPDCDTVSALQRIALQAGVARRAMPAELLKSGRWTLVRDEAEAHAVEGAWIRLHTAPEGAITPSAALARFAVQGIGPTLLHAGSGGNGVAIAAGLLVLLALGCGWYGLATFAFVLSGLAVVLRQAAALLLRVERDSLGMPPSRLPRQLMFGWLVDGLLMVIVAWNMPGQPALQFGYRAFPPLMLLALLRLVPRAINAARVGWLEDRLLLALLLALVAFFGVLGEAVHILAVVMALFGICLPGSGRQLTRA